MSDERPERIGETVLRLGATVVAPLAYQGKAGCESVICTRLYDPDTKTFAPACRGWHCSYCDEPCSYQGHGCDAAQTMIDAALERENPPTESETG